MTDLAADLPIPPAPRAPTPRDSGAIGDTAIETLVPTRKEGRFHHGDLRLSLLAAAARALAARGDADISLRELARELGVTHAAAYRHFAAKSDLLAALATRGWVRLAEVAASVVAEAASADAAEQLRRVGRAYVAFARANPGPYHAMHLKPLRHGRDFPALDVAVDHVLLLLGHVINDGQTAGTLRADIAAHDFAGAVLAALDGAARAVLAGAEGEAAADHLVDLIATGAGCAPGTTPGRRAAASAQPATAAAEKRDRRRAEPGSLTLDLFG